WATPSTPPTISPSSSWAGSPPRGSGPSSTARSSAWCSAPLPRTCAWPPRWASTSTASTCRPSRWAASWPASRGPSWCPSRGRCSAWGWTPSSSPSWWWSSAGWAASRAPWWALSSWAWCGKPASPSFRRSSSPCSISWRRWCSSSVPPGSSGAHESRRRPAPRSPHPRPSRGGAPRRHALRGHSVSDGAALLRPRLRHRRPGLQPAAGLYGAPVLRPLRVLRGGGLRGGLHGEVLQVVVDGALRPRRGPRLRFRVLDLRLPLRSLHAHLLRHPHHGPVPGAVEPRLQVLLVHRRVRRAPGADPHAPGRRLGPGAGQRQVRFPLASLLLLRPRALRGGGGGDVAHRALALRQGAPGHPGQRDPRGVRGRAGEALSAGGLRGVRDLYRPRGRAVGAAQRPHHPRHPPLDVLGQDRLLHRAG